MTRARILELLDLVVLELGNRVPPPQASSDVSLPSAEEWAYVKGLASGAVLRMRAHLADLAGR